MPSSTEYDRLHPKKVFIRSARARAKKYKSEFNLTEDDIELVTHCPILGFELKYGGGFIKKDNSATLDRLNNDLGYIRGNVWIISSLANTMKANSRYWHRAKFANWTIKSLIQNQKHISVLEPYLLSVALEKLKHISASVPSLVEKMVSELLAAV